MNTHDYEWGLKNLFHICLYQNRQNNIEMYSINLSILSFNDPLLNNDLSSLTQTSWTRIGIAGIKGFMTKSVNSEKIEKRQFFCTQFQS